MFIPVLLLSSSTKRQFLCTKNVSAVGVFEPSRQQLQTLLEDKRDGQTSLLRTLYCLLLLVLYAINGLNTRRAVYSLLSLDVRKISPTHKKNECVCMYSVSASSRRGRPLPKVGSIQFSALWAAPRPNHPQGWALYVTLDGFPKIQALWCLLTPVCRGGVSLPRWYVSSTRLRSVQLEVS